MKGYKKRQKGIGLIEVLIAAVVFALGSLAVVQLQGKFFKSSSSSNARSVAMSIAQDKLEDLRGVASTTGGFVTIAANAGGRLCVAVVDLPDTGVACTAGVLSRPTGNVAKNNAIYTRTWNVANSYYDTAGTLLSQANCTTSSTCGPDNTSVPAIPDQKNITVTIAWTDTDGSAQTVVFDGLINANSTSSGGTILADTGGSGESPVVPHIVLAAPEVIPGKVYTPPPPGIDGTSWAEDYTDTEKADAWAALYRCNVEAFRSTEAPDPELDQNSGGIVDNTIVGFSTSTYLKYETCGYTNSADNGVAKLIKYEEEEFKTINCSCVLAASGDGYDQGHNLVTKARTGTKQGQSNQQSSFCDLCCLNHHENISGDYLCASGNNPENCYDPERTSDSDYTSNDHKHYLFSDLANPIIADGGIYNEVCRLKRVEGFYTVVQDWKLLALNIMNENDLTDDTIGIVDGYQEYIGKTINQYLAGVASTPPNPWVAPTPTVPTDGTKMMARAIYIDYLSAVDKASLVKSGVDIAYQDIDVPSYEYKVTDLVNWKTISTNDNGTIDNTNKQHTSTASPCPASSSTNHTCVDSPTISQIVNVGNNQTIDKGVYRTNSPSENINIIAEMKGSPTGVIAGVSIEPNDILASTTFQSKYFIDNGNGSNVGTIGLSLSSLADFTCAAKWGSGSNAPINNMQNSSSWSSITLACNPTSGNVSTCQGYGSAQGTITVTAANTSSLSCGYSDATTQYCPATFTNTISSLTGTKTCSVQLSKSGNSSTCQLVCQ